jgi:hypothetical protein
MISEVDVRDWNDKPVRTKDSTGTKYDHEKPPMALLDAEFLEGVAKVLGFGANKYAAHNWRNVLLLAGLLVLPIVTLVPSIRERMWTLSQAFLTATTWAVVLCSFLACSKHDRT